MTGAPRSPQTDVGECLRIRVMMAGLTFKQARALLHLPPDRAAELIGDRGAFTDLHELRCELRAALNDGPDLRDVYQALALGQLVNDTAGRDIRWVRIILKKSLKAWAEDHGYSTWWWSKFETEEGRARRFLACGCFTVREWTALEDDMAEAAAKLGRLFPWAMMPCHMKLVNSGG